MKVSFKIKPVVTAAFVVSATIGGLVAGAYAQEIAGAAKDRYQDLQIFARVLNLVQQHYVEDVDAHKLIYGGIKGMLQELDPHTNFLPPEVYKDFESETSGEFGGIGIEITVQNDVLTVISPIEDTPAWHAGIQANDKIVEINGVSTKGFTLAEAATHMRGKKGSKVTMGIYRDGFEKPKPFTIERGIVKVKSVKYTDLEDGYGYLRLTSFIENSGPDMEKALKNMQKSKDGIKGVIIDLRRNPGGLLDQAVRISDLFLEKGKIVSTAGRGMRDKEEIFAKKEGTFSGFPVIVLVNESSASASEILAGALQDNKRAVIMGQPTFGKGSVQSVVRLSDGSGLKLTVARYYTPSGRSIQAEGIKPDVVIDDVDSEAFKKAVIRKDSRREQDIGGHLLGDKEKKAKEASKETAPSSAVSVWWKEKAEDKGAKLTGRDKLLHDDFQVAQAFNYLKAWSVMEKLNQVPIPAAASASGAGEREPTSKQ